jgi:hypothetical protein
MTTIDLNMEKERYESDGLNTDPTDSDNSIVANDEDYEDEHVNAAICPADEYVSVNEDNADDDAFATGQKMQLYENSSLAAAQMMQLMNSTGSVGSGQSVLADRNDALPLTGIDHEKENIPICKYCNKLFANFSNLNHHISAIHLNQSKWICSQCGKVKHLIPIFLLVLHFLLTHATCLGFKVCSSKSNLKVHLRVHLRVKPYHCRWCLYSCMHHSSIRDHLAKVHPENTHTPLQPGYIFNSHAVPEPDVFNSKSFNKTSFVNDSVGAIKREAPASNETTPNAIKRERHDLIANNERVKRSRTNNYTDKHCQQLESESPINASPHANMSNIYNAYNMARMLPFMYPMHMQYVAAAAAAAANPNTYTANHHSPSIPVYGLMNNSSQFNARQSAFSPLHTNFSYANTNPSNSFEEQTTTSSNLSYTNTSNTHSSRSSSLSPPSDKPSTNDIVSLVSKQIKHIATSCMEDNHVGFIKSTSVAKNESSSSHGSYAPAMASSPKITLTVDQILSNRANKSTQTEPPCSNCPYCNKV